LTSQLWKVAIVTLISALIVLGLFNLGLITIAGSGAPRVRYQAEDVAPPSEPMVWSFDDLGEGTLPDGAQVLSEPRFGGWAVRSEADAPTATNALCQTGMGEFPTIALSDAVLGDLAMSTQFKPVSGMVDQAAGLIFRIQDEGNYYILRANALENNVNLYKYASGRRSLMNGRTATVPNRQWQELSVQVAGNHFVGFLNGQPVVEAFDDAYAAGRVGLWTKADSVTCFDDVWVTPQ
jgi:hypothetical protein